MIGRAAAYTDTPTANNATYQLDFPFDWRQDMLRLDYRPATAHSFYLRYLHDDYDLIEPRGTFINAPLPTIPTNRLRPGFGYQVAHTWVAQPEPGQRGQGQRLVERPAHPAGRRRLAARHLRLRVPAGVRGRPLRRRHSRRHRSPAPARRRSSPDRRQSLLSPTTDITAHEYADLGHATRTRCGRGVLVTRNRKDQNGRFAYTGAVNFNPAGNPNSTGCAFADALLGNFRTYSEGADDPIGFFRFTQYGAFVSDNWRVRPNLSLELGLRYEFQQPDLHAGQQHRATSIRRSTTRHRDPSESQRHDRSPAPAIRYNGLIRAGDGIPEDQRDRVTIDEAAAALIPTGAPRGLYDTQHLFMPRFSGAYTLNDKWVLRGGFGLFYDRPEGNVIFSQVNLPPFLPSVAVENGNLANPLAGQSSAAVGARHDQRASIRACEMPRQLNYSVSVQRELPWGHFARGRLRRQSRTRPAVAAGDQPAVVRGAARRTRRCPRAQRANTNFLRPYSGYSSIRQRRSDAFSDYNGLQLYLNKRRGDFRYTVSYTLSKATGLGSGNGDNPEDDLDKEFHERAR